MGFVEVHIEQGPVLNELNLPLGIVTAFFGAPFFIYLLKRRKNVLA